FTYTGSSYYIDLGSGQTLWKYKIDRSRYDINAGVDGQYFTAGANYEPVEDDRIYTGNLASSAEETLLLVPDYTPVTNPPFNGQGRVTVMLAFSSGGNKYLAFGIENPYTEQTESGWGLTELNLFNVTQNKYAYSKIPLNLSHETRVIYDLIYDGTNLFCQSTNYIHCFDAMTGYERWRTRVGSKPVLSSMILADGRLYTANEDRYVYCLDPNIGQIIWRKESTGTCSELSYLNGVIYFLGGGDGLLHAVDASTGDQLWKVQSPDLKKNSGAFFYGSCIAVQGQGDKKPVVVATTGLNAYAFEAIK
ncbi:MAG: PQQ-binding-like beta-propeller repeat protein, partial [Chryseolinea sp.]